MKINIYDIAQHLLHWCSSGNVFRDWGFSIPFGAAVVNEGVERALADGMAQETTQWLIALTVAFTLFVKVFMFIKANVKKKLDK